MIAGLSFLAPWMLVGLIALPALFLLLRITPPPPRRLPLPTLPLVKDILGKEKEPARTPWWLLAIRLAAAAALILAVAGPRWQPQSEVTATGSDRGTLIILIDNGWTSAPGWAMRIERAKSLIENASSRPILLLAAGEPTNGLQPETAQAALSRLMTLLPKPHLVDREPALDLALSALKAEADSRIVWIGDGIVMERQRDIVSRFLAEAAGRLDVIATLPDAPLAIAGIGQDAEGLQAMIRLAAPSASSREGLVRAFDEKGRDLGEATFRLDAGQSQVQARLVMPIELINDIARIEIVGEKSAGAVHLLNAAHGRRRVALVTGESSDTAQPLISARYFVTQALKPFADLREPPRGINDPILRVLDERPDILVLVDIGTVAGENGTAITRFVENGGMLIRFAGSGLAEASDDLLPVRLRRGGRILGGALSWDKPRRLGAFPEGSPFAGLPAQDDVRVERQVLAEPDSELSRASWAVLEDGTPLVTGAPRGKGQIVLFHVTGDTSWSNLPLSGAFVEMLRRTLQIAKSQNRTVEPGSGEVTAKAPARLTLDGFGVLSSATRMAQPIDSQFAGPADADHPPGFYGPTEASLAVNALTTTTRLEPIAFGNAHVVPLRPWQLVDFRPWLMILAAVLVVADALAMAVLGGALSRWTSALPFRRAFATALFAGAILTIFSPVPRAEAQQARELPAIRQEDVRSSLRPRLAYVVTGDPRVDEASRAGLFGLGRILAERTSLQLDEPIGLDPARDELVFYSMIYWPIIAGQPNPPERAIRAIDAFMKTGGTVIFDTRDAFVQRPGGAPTPETRALRAMLGALSIPALEPVPQDHVLTKTFYLLNRFVGRYAAGDSWVEALSGPAQDTKVPARAGDRVSPIIITSNDLAAAWAMDRLGNPLFPLVPGEPRQRELAYRTGVNLVMYVFTGNYKADQVHVPALLERLGQ
ncbi:MAG TPA: DUF4159 domain-containing protein [Rhabdaerophilum sp.]|nr:DUF4159 domain-containing protein [Rhabdaerophilum sp.]